MEDYFRELIRGIDSSLLEEWERLRNPDFVAADGATPTNPRGPRRSISRATPPRFAGWCAPRSSAFCRTSPRAIGKARRRGSPPAKPAAPSEGAPLSPEAKRIEAAFAPYFEAHGRFRLDPEGRSAKHTHWTDEAAAPPWNGTLPRF